MSRQVIGEEGIRRWSAWPDLALLACSLGFSSAMGREWWMVDGR